MKKAIRISIALLIVIGFTVGFILKKNNKEIPFYDSCDQSKTFLIKKKKTNKK